MFNITIQWFILTFRDIRNILKVSFVAYLSFTFYNSNITKSITVEQWATQFIAFLTYKLNLNQLDFRFAPNIFMIGEHKKLAFLCEISSSFHGGWTSNALSHNISLDYMWSENATCGFKHCGIRSSGIGSELCALWVKP